MLFGLSQRKIKCECYIIGVIFIVGESRSSLLRYTFDTIEYIVNKVFSVFACHFDEGRGREAVSSSEIFLETAAISKISTQRAR
jgi:hypothetical protein